MAQAPRFLQDLVGQVFREHRRTEHVTLVTLQQHWQTLVGPGLAERTWPSRLQQGVLWITAPDSSWAYQLQFLKNELLSGIRAGLPAFQLTDLRFKVGEMPVSESSAAEVTPPASLPRKAEPPVEPPITPMETRAPELPAPATPELIRAAEAITDPTLRSAFLRAMDRQSHRKADKP